VWQQPFANSETHNQGEAEENIMEMTALNRSFSFNGLKLPEPDERMTVEEVKAF